MVETFCANCEKDTICSISTCDVCKKNYLKCNDCGENGSVDGGCNLYCGCPCSSK